MQSVVNQVHFLVSLRLYEIFRAALLRLASKMNSLPNHQLEIMRTFIILPEWNEV